MKKIIISALVFTSMVTIHAQGLKRKMADQYFAQFEYYKAAPIYDELAMLTVKGKKSNWDEARLAAESYYNTNNYSKAEFWYQKMENAGVMNHHDYTQYILVLQLLGKYDEAFIYIDKMYQVDPTDRVMDALHHDRNYISELMADSILYKIRVMPFNTNMGDFAPAYYKNGMVYTSRKRNTGFVNTKHFWDNGYFTDIYYVEKDGEKFRKKGKLLGQPFKSTPHDGPVVFSKDGKTAIITQNDRGTVARKEVVHLAMYFSTMDANGKWSKPEAFPFNSKEHSVGHPALSPDGKTLIFASDHSGGTGGVDLYMCELIDGVWSQPENMGAIINSEGDDMFPYIADDGTLYFASNGHVGLGGLDIYKVGKDHLAVENMGYPLNTRFDDFGLILNDEGSKGHFSSNREDWIDRIYEADIKVAEFYLECTVLLDDCKNSPVPNQEVILENLDTRVVETHATDEQGRLNLKLKKNSAYSITTSKDNYKLESRGEVSTHGKTSSENFQTTLKLTPTSIKVKAVAMDKADQHKIHEAKIKVTQKSSGKTWDVTTNEDGSAELNLERNQDYKIDCHFHGYLEHSQSFSTSGNKCDDEMEVKVPLDKIKKGDVFVINNIFYDYDAATLRVESEKELDKLAEFLLENLNIKVELSSHTDSRGGDSYNLKLSQKRAQSAVDYLVNHGVPKNNIVPKGFGETKLVNRCKNDVPCSEEEHQENRRTEIKILQVK